MKRFLLVAMASVSLVSCGGGINSVSNIPASPAEVANKTILDEKLGIGVETAYKAWRLAVELAVDTGVLKGEKAVRVAKIDNQAYAFTLATQAAYKAGNNDSYIASAKGAIDAVKQGIAVMKGN